MTKRLVKAHTDASLRLAINQRDFQEPLKLPSEIDGHARVHAALTILKAMAATCRKDSFMPDIGMNVATLIGCESKAHKVIR